MNPTLIEAVRGDYEAYLKEAFNADISRKPDGAYTGHAVDFGWHTFLKAASFRFELAETFEAWRHSFMPEKSVHEAWQAWKGVADYRSPAEITTTDLNAMGINSTLVQRALPKILDKIEARYESPPDDFKTPVPVTVGLVQFAAGTPFSRVVDAIERFTQRIQPASPTACTVNEAWANWVATNKRTVHGTADPRQVLFTAGAQFILDKMRFYADKEVVGWTRKDMDIIECTRVLNEGWAGVEKRTKRELVAQIVSLMDATCFSSSMSHTVRALTDKVEDPEVRGALKHELDMAFAALNTSYATTKKMLHAATKKQEEDAEIIAGIPAADAFKGKLNPADLIVTRLPGAHTAELVGIKLTHGPTKKSVVCDQHDTASRNRIAAGELLILELAKNEVSEDAHQKKVLADALTKVLIASGHFNDHGGGFSGPQLLMFADELENILSDPAPVTSDSVVLGALYEFCAQLTTSEVPVTFSSGRDSSQAVTLINQFIKATKLSTDAPITTNWKMFIKSATTPTGQTRISDAFRSWNNRGPIAYDMTKATASSKSTYESGFTEHAWQGFCHGYIWAEQEGFEHSKMNEQLLASAIGKPVPGAPRNAVDDLYHTAKDRETNANRWLMVPGVAEEHQLDLMKLNRDIDAMLADKGEAVYEPTTEIALKVIGESSITAGDISSARVSDLALNTNIRAAAFDHPRVLIITNLDAWEAMPKDQPVPAIVAMDQTSTQYFVPKEKEPDYEAAARELCDAMFNGDRSTLKINHCLRIAKKMFKAALA